MPEPRSKADIRKLLVALLRKHGASEAPVSDTTSIYHDLRVWGDDAYELLTEMDRAYPTFKEGCGFKFTHYFQCEGSVGTSWMLLRWLGVEDRTKQPLTIGHLVDVFAGGAWFKPK